MKARTCAVLAAAVCLCATGRAANNLFKAPDSIVLKDGRTIRGLIIKNSVDSVLLQEEFGEHSYPKSGIVRIRDEADIGVLFTDISRKGALPSWRVMANDLRTHDEIKSLVEIPATTVTNGEFRNVPYKSFRANQNIELNIYGDPNHPAGIELGIYGSLKNNAKLQRALRAYFAGFLTTRQEIAALYGLDLKKGKATAGDITFETAPPTDEDAFGAWWISLYNRHGLDAARLSDAKYAALTKPADKVIDRNGSVIAQGWTAKDVEKIEHHKALRGHGAILLRGFYRDANGNFQLLKGTPL